MTRAYLLGAMHDGTLRVRTARISQKEEAYVIRVRQVVESLGFRAWTYREGRNRDLYVVEFSRLALEPRHIRSRREVIDYVRGYFDAEGGIPSLRTREPYIYFAQKDLVDLAALRAMLGGLGISCGKVHNPSQRRDPNYWRFYVSRQSHRRFVDLVGSWHPRKAPLLHML